MTDPGPQPDADDARPWEQPGALRRDAEPDHDALPAWLGPRGVGALRLDHGGLQPRPPPVRCPADDVDLLLRLVADLVDLDAGELALKRRGELLELGPVLGRD